MHEDEEHVPAQPSGLSLSIQSVLMIVAAAFLFGFGISAVFLFRGKQMPFVGKSDSMQAPDSTPAVGTTLPDDEIESSGRRSPVRKSDHV